MGSGEGGGEGPLAGSAPKNTAILLPQASLHSASEGAHRFDCRPQHLTGTAARTHILDDIPPTQYIAARQLQKNNQRNRRIRHITSKKDDTAGYEPMSPLGLPWRSNDLIPLERLRMITMCPFLEAWSGARDVIFARRTATDRVAVASFRLARDGNGIEKCRLRVELKEKKYRRLIAKWCRKEALEKLSPTKAKSRVFHARWRGERQDRLAPRQFAMAGALMDGVDILPEPPEEPCRS